MFQFYGIFDHRASSDKEEDVLDQDAPVKPNMLMKCLVNQMAKPAWSETPGEESTTKSDTAKALGK